mmetsp:Transcript_3287/g.6478  ORF Transcript_3287/g.6478 Transcript_3287/m.6478 type:complete len:1060 (-) Transcript_3287:207-3386(-)
MAQLFGQLVSTVSNVLDINQATLSGAIDVVATRGPDGMYSTTPFHVRFGKIQVLRPNQKKVTVHINGKRTTLPMRLGRAGEAYFVLDDPSQPVPSPNRSPETTRAKTYSPGMDSSSPVGSPFSASSPEDGLVHRAHHQSSPPHLDLTAKPLEGKESRHAEEAGASTGSSPVARGSDDENDKPSNSRSAAATKAASSASSWHWGWGSLPNIPASPEQQAPHSDTLSDTAATAPAEAGSGLGRRRSPTRRRRSDDVRSDGGEAGEQEEEQGWSIFGLFRGNRKGEHKTAATTGRAGGGRGADVMTMEGEEVNGVRHVRIPVGPGETPSTVRMSLPFGTAYVHEKHLPMRTERPQSSSIEADPRTHAHEGLGLGLGPADGASDGLGTRTIGAEPFARVELSLGPEGSVYEQTSELDLHHAFETGTPVTLRDLTLEPSLAWNPRLLARTAPGAPPRPARQLLSEMLARAAFGTAGVGERKGRGAALSSSAAFARPEETEDMREPDSGDERESVVFLTPEYLEGRGAAAVQKTRMSASMSMSSTAAAAGGGGGEAGSLGSPPPAMGSYPKSIPGSPDTHPCSSDRSPDSRDPQMSPRSAEEELKTQQSRGGLRRRRSGSVGAQPGVRVRWGGGESSMESSPSASPGVSGRERDGDGKKKLLRKSRPKRKSLRPNQEMMERIVPLLRNGRNRLDFTVKSRLQGVQTLTCGLYLWPVDSRIVVSDVDGTITRSDLLGNIFPLVGRDWSHPGIAKLLTSISSNGYRVLYLTSRAIGQANMTRGYIRALRQSGGASLPDGPLIMSPDRLVKSLKREVIYRRPQEFKILALRDIRRLFAMSTQPFAAGFGNRVSDLVAYLAVGIPAERIFIIDKNSEIRQAGNSMYSQSYPSLCAIADDMFPARESKSLVMRPSSPDHKEAIAKAESAADPPSNKQRSQVDTDTSTPTKNAVDNASLSRSAQQQDAKQKRDSDRFSPVSRDGGGDEGRTSGREMPRRFDDLSYWSVPLPSIDDLERDLEHGESGNDDGGNGDNDEVPTGKRLETEQEDNHSGGWGQEPTVGSGAKPTKS